MATWSQIFRALALKLAKIQRWKEKGVIFQFSFKNPGIAKKALVKNIFFFILELTFCNYLSFSIEKSRVFLKKTWWQISSSVDLQTPDVLPALRASQQRDGRVQRHLQSETSPGEAQVQPGDPESKCRSSVSRL